MTLKYNREKMVTYDTKNLYLKLFVFLDIKVKKVYNQM